MKQPVIPVFLCTDNPYAVPTYITLFSLLKNYRGEQGLRVYLLTSGDFTEKNRRLIERLAEQYSAMELRILNMKDAFASVRIQNKRITTPSLYRLMIPAIMRENQPDAEKCIYLDSDLIVEGNIGELFAVSLGSDYLGGVRDRLLANDAQTELKECLGVPTLKNYINSGVLLYNLKEIHAHGIGKRLTEAGEKNDTPFCDQDVINTVCYGKIKLLPYRFNISHSCLYDEDEANYSQFGADALKEAQRNPLIYHYNARKKPWSHRFMMLGGKWWKYVRMQEKEILREYVRPFIRENKRPPDVREAVSAWLKEHGMYYPLRSIYHFVKGS